MQLCPCGFANNDDAMSCAACGAMLDAGSSDQTGPAPSSSLLLENLCTGETIRIPSPGGVLGRAGDFSPDSFSPRVSGVHAVVSTSDGGAWTIEHTGRNASSVERGGVWSVLRAGAPQPLFGGETLKLADMVFRVQLDGERPPVHGVSDRAPQSVPQSAPADPSCPSSTKSDAATAWSVRCPVCGTEHAAAGPEARISTCSLCKDPLDARQIARVAPRPVPAA